MNRAILIPAVLLAAAVARADEPQRIAVSVTGQATAVADTVEVELTVSAKADSSADAERAFRGKLATVLGSLKENKAPSHPVKKAKLAEEKAKEKPAHKKSDDDDDDDDAKKPARPDKSDKEGTDDAVASAIPVELSERGLAFGVKTAKDDANPFKAIARMGGGPAPNADPPMVFSSRVVATIRGVKKLDPKLVARRVSLLIDLGIESGADGTESGTAPTVRFLVDDPEALRSRAYEDAMSKGVARAATIAALGSRTIAGVASVREGGALGKADDLQAVQMKAVQNMFGASGSPDAVTGFEVKAEVDLSLEFDLARSGGERATLKANNSGFDLAKALDALAKTKDHGGFFMESDYRDAVQRVLEAATK